MPIPLSLLGKKDLEFNADHCLAVQGNAANLAHILHVRKGCETVVNAEKYNTTKRIRKDRMSRRYKVSCTRDKVTNGMSGFRRVATSH